MKIIKTSFKQKTFAKRVYENMKKHSLWVFSKDFKKATTKKLCHVWRSVLPSFQTWLLIFSYYFQIYPINNSIYLFFFILTSYILYTIYLVYIAWIIDILSFQPDFLEVPYHINPSSYMCRSSAFFISLFKHI